MPSTRAALTLTMLAASGLAGCVDGSTQHARGGVLRMTISEFRIRPQSAIASAGTVTFVVHNAGRLAHTLRVRQGSNVLGGTRTIAPGESCTGTVTLSAGVYHMFSSVRRDDALGVWGDLTVKGSAVAPRITGARLPAPALAGRSNRPSPNPAATDASGAGIPSAKIKPCPSKSTATPSARSSATSPPG